MLRRGIENSEQFENLLSERTAVRSAVQYKYCRKLGMDSWKESNNFVIIVKSLNVKGIINWLPIYGKSLEWFDRGPRPRCLEIQLLSVCSVTLYLPCKQNVLDVCLFQISSSKYFVFKNIYFRYLAAGRVAVREV